MNMPCQDAHYIDKLSKAMIITVADGLGSADNGDVGARVASRVMNKAVRCGLTQKPKWTVRRILGKAYTITQKELLTYSQKQGYPLSSYATTLITSVIVPIGIATLHVGDGVVVAKVDDELKIITMPRMGEYANEVVPITHIKQSRKLAEFKITKGRVQFVAVMTDGLERLSMQLSDLSPFEPFFKPFFSAITSDEMSDNELEEALTSYLGSDDVCSRTSDDKTLVLVGKR
ncbi:MAG: PP2C family serine/threonine-protein phosphatase [Chloroflexota bacterium]